MAEGLRAHPGPGIRLEARPSERCRIGRPSPYRAAPRLGTGLLVAAVSLILVSLTLATAPVGAAHSPPSTAPHPTASGTGRVCNSTVWQSSVLTIDTPGCYAQFVVEYNDQNVTHSGPSESYAFGFALPWIAEINAAGDIVRLASEGYEVPQNTPTPYGSNTSVVSWSTTTSSGPNEVNVTLNQTLNVTAGSGVWNATTCSFFGGSSWGGCGTDWTISNTTYGTANLSVTFLLVSANANTSIGQSSNGTYAVKFDVGISDWRWADTSDRLGIAFGAPPERLGPVFVFNPSTQILSEEQNGSPFASLVFGGEGDLSYPGGGTSTANVSDQVELSTAPFPSAAFALLTFENSRGGYSSMNYDPWVEFSPDGVVIPPGGTALPGGGSPGSGILGTNEVLVASALIAAAGVSLGAVGLVRRRSHARRDGEELMADVNRLISERRRPPPPH